MNYTDFITETVCNLQPSIVNQMKESLLGSYLTFSILQPENVNKEILAEKLCDYFVTLDIKTNISFDKHVETYMNQINKIVYPHIGKIPQAKKGDPNPVIIPRSRRYYDRALAYKNTKDLSLRKILDYSRIMMCLYMEIIKQGHKEIDNFNYSADCLDLFQIIDSLKKEEEPSKFPVKVKKKRFDTKEIYSSDSCTMILTVIALCSIKNDSMRGENEYE